MDYDTYNAESVQLAVELANLDFSDAIAVDDFLHSAHLMVEGGTSGASVTTADLERLAALIRDIVEAGSDDAVALRLNGMLAEFAPQPRLTTHDGTLHLHFSDAGAPLIARLGATIGVGMAYMICRYGRSRLGICAAGDCADVFVDTSRNRSRRYCSETCASRTTVSAYRARRRAATL